MDLGSLHPKDGSIHSDKKVALGYRLALGLNAAIYAEGAVVWEGPRARAATVTAGHGLAAAGARGKDSDPYAAATSRSVTVEFATAAPAGISLNATAAACPPVILPVFCTGAGFELLVDGNWTHAAGVSPGPPSNISAGTFFTVVVHPPAAVGGSAIERVRYAYADWPVVNIRNNDADALPARLFDIPVGT